MLCNPARPCLRQVHGAGTQASPLNHQITRPSTTQAAGRCSLISLDRYRQCRLISRPARQARQAGQTSQPSSLDARAEAALPSRFQACDPVLVALWLCWCLIATAARVARIRRAISSRMLQSVCWATRSPCCATPRCLVRTRNSRVAPSRGPPDPGGYSTIHSSPILRSAGAAQPSAARRATCIIHCHRHIRAPPASWDRKISHQRHSSTAPLSCLHVLLFQGPAGRAAYHPQLRPHLFSSRASHHVSSRSQCGPELRPILVLLLVLALVLVRSCGQGTDHNVTLYPNVRTAVQYLFPSHRLAKRNACGTKRYGLVACQPVPTACRSSNAWPSVDIAHLRSPGQPWEKPARVDRPAGAGSAPRTGHAAPDSSSAFR